MVNYELWLLCSRVLYMNHQNLCSTKDWERSPPFVSFPSAADAVEYERAVQWCQQQPGPEALCFQVVCPSISFSWTQYFSIALKEFLQIWHKRSLGLKDELIRFWCSEIKGQGHSELAKHCFGHNPQINMLIMIQFNSKLYKDKMKWQPLYPNGQRSTSLWHHNVLQKHLWPLSKAGTQEEEIVIIFPATRPDGRR